MSLAINERSGLLKHGHSYMSIKGCYIVLCTIFLGISFFHNNTLIEHYKNSSKSDSIGLLPTVGGEDIEDNDVGKLIVPSVCESPSRGHFDRIYNSRLWGPTLRDASEFYSEAKWPQNDARMKSSSGSGSDLGISTQTSLRVIKETIQKFNITSMIDIPCGDVNWIFDSFVTDSLPLYLGLDVTSALIEINKKRFAHHSNKLFAFWDATACTLPKHKLTKMPRPFDLIHVRDVIQHMGLDLGVRFFCNVFKSGARVLVATTFPNSENKEIPEGSYYQNNLSKEPFSFPASVPCTPTHPEIEPDHTCVYDLSEPWVHQFVLNKCKVD